MKNYFVNVFILASVLFFHCVIENNCCKFIEKKGKVIILNENIYIGIILDDNKNVILTISLFGENDDNSKKSILRVKKILNIFEYQVLYIYKSLIENSKIKNEDILKIAGTYLYNLKYIVNDNKFNKIQWTIDANRENNDNFCLYLKKYKFKINFSLNQNMSLFLDLKLIKGENDGNLIFPICISYKFTLIDQIKNRNSGIYTEPIRKAIGFDNYYRCFTTISKDDVKSYTNGYIYGDLTISLEIEFN